MKVAICPQKTAANSRGSSPALTIPEHKIDFHLSLNSNEAWYPQLVEVYYHKRSDTWGKFFHYLSGIEVAPDWFQDAVKDIAINAYGSVLDSDLAIHVKEYRKSIDSCNRVLVVAHSQGNFYANYAWSEIYSGQSSKGYKQEDFHSLGIVSVATPASYVGNWIKKVDDHKLITDYVTLTNDRIMVLVRTVYPATLLGNYTNSHDDPDFWHHNFVESYLKGNRSGPRIISSVKSILDNLEPLPLAREEIQSSSIKSVGYLKESEILEVEFLSNESVYRYYQVPEAVYKELMFADSIGGYLYSKIRNKYKYKKIIEGV
ncbi:KTSC domain-containing protein [Vibrio sp. JC009]|uniref:KTSC domain-containing protein n=1 Tax=Vibrio sp. JC009 TaxID=2912314 RepID=UPI0023AEAC7C|nr:KTSC domain-containing protein [Vibrio sp. JC009]WED23234.1 KTSC domain-containing protein [Vibrio sp. JC009]